MRPDVRDEDLNVAPAEPPIALLPVTGTPDRGAKNDLLSLLEVVERAIKAGAVDEARDPGKRLTESYLILRRWWP